MLAAMRRAVLAAVLAGLALTGYAPPSAVPLQFRARTAGILRQAAAEALR